MDLHVIKLPVDSHSEEPCLCVGCKLSFRMCVPVCMMLVVFKSPGGTCDSQCEAFQWLGAFVHI